MRKLNKKNKTYIFLLLFLVVILVVVFGIFIVKKIIDMNIKYEIKGNSYVYNTDNELVHIKDDTYVKKNFVNKYYIMVDDKKVNVGSNAVFIQNDTKEISLFGTYYHVIDNGEVKKISGYNVIKSTINSYFYKINDRKYLIISPQIWSTDESLKTNNFLLVNIDKQGNGYLYNHEVNMKTFKELLLKTDNYDFNVNEELLNLNNEEIDLSKINGSTNEYVKKEEEVNETEEEPKEKEKPEIPEIPPRTIYTTEVEKQTVTTEEYVYRKTTILGIDSTTDTITINYIVYDPFNEYSGLYVLVNNVRYDMSLSESIIEIKNLDANTEYSLNFYYTYNGNNNGNLYDSHVIYTKEINANISLVKVTSYDVTYKVRVDDYNLDSCKISLYVDDNLESTMNINTYSALNGGYEGTINYTSSGSFITLRLNDCYYKGKLVDLSASYKFKI